MHQYLTSKFRVVLSFTWLGTVCYIGDHPKFRMILFHLDLHLKFYKLGLQWIPPIGWTLLSLQITQRINPSVSDKRHSSSNDPICNNISEASLSLSSQGTRPNPMFYNKGIYRGMCGHLEPNVSYLTKGQIDTVFQAGFIAQNGIS